MITLELLPASEYRGVTNDDPIRFYYWPVLGKLYRRRVELALNECRGGQRILEVGFGTGLTFINLSKMYQEIHGLDLSVDVKAVGEVFEKRQIKTYLKNGDVTDMHFEDSTFDTVLLISILEHLKPEQLEKAFKEIFRVLKPNGQIIYGVPVERPLMVLAFRMLGVNIREYHYSSHIDVHKAAQQVFQEIRTIPYSTLLGQVYEIGHFVKGMGEK